MKDKGALFCRFDDLLEYTLPDRDAIHQVLHARLNAFAPDNLDWRKTTNVASGLSQADLARAADEVIKGAILCNEDAVTTEALLSALQQRRIAQQVVSTIVNR